MYLIRKVAGLLVALFVISIPLWLSTGVAETTIQNNGRSSSGSPVDGNNIIDPISQTDPIISEPVIPTLSTAVRDLPPFEQAFVLDREVNPRINYLGDVTAYSKYEGSVDPLLAVQAKAPAPAVDNFNAPIVNYDGQGFSSVNPPDTVGDIGLTHYIQAINDAGGTRVQIYNKDGSSAASPFYLDVLGSGNCTDGLGDPIILYDRLADRWMLSEFSNNGNQLCVYISQTADPTGSYYGYAFTAVNSFPDYPKYGVWPDGYYIGTNENSVTLYALDRSSMLTGAAASLQSFNVTGLTGFGFQEIIPSDLDGATPPPLDSPNYFMRHRDTENHGQGNCPVNDGGDCLEIFEFTVDWDTPANSNINGPIAIQISEFDSDLCGLTSFNCFPQPGSSVTLDPLREVVMQRLQYRNFGTHETLVGNFVTDVDGTDHGGIRWFELRKSGASSWSLYQEGTYAPDASHRWMGAISMDGSGNIALGYNVSDATTVYPSLRYTGRLNGDPISTMSQGENNIVAGSSPNGSNRYGDYSAMGVDPADDCTFWFTGMYNNSSQWSTRIASFKFDGCSGAMSPAFNMETAPASQTVCASIDAAYTVNLTAVGGFVGDVDLAALGAPGAATFTVDPVTLDNSSILTISGASVGNYSFDIVGSGVTTPSLVQTNTVSLDIFAGSPSVPTLTTPADGAVTVTTLPTYVWNAVANATSYDVEIATDAGFGTVVDSATGLTTAWYETAVSLNASTTYYWRVRANNVCGTGAHSAVYSFTTANIMSGSYPAADVPLPIPISGTEGVMTSTINVPVSGAITDINVVNLAGTHSWIGDLDFQLESPAGTTILLRAQSCDSNQDFDIDYDDGAPSGASPCPPTDGSTYQPAGSLSDFNNEDAVGTWTLTITDYATGDDGQLDSWGLEIHYVVEDPKITVNSAVLSSLQEPDTQVTRTLTINNVGTAVLDWSIFEADALTFSDRARDDDPITIALDYLGASRRGFNLTTTDLSEATVDSYYTEKSDFTQVQFIQQLNGIEVYNGMILVNIDGNGRVLNTHNQFVPDLANKANTAVSTLTAEDAVNAAAAELGLTTQGLTISGKQIGGAAQETLFNDGGISRQPIPAKLVYQPMDKETRLAWLVDIYMIDEDNWWSLRIDAVTGELLDRFNYVIHDEWGEFVGTENSAIHAPSTTCSGGSGNNDYCVYPIPVEAPHFITPLPPGDGRTIETAPWLNAATASPYGWHDTDGAAGAEFINTRGNNVYAYEDRADANTPGTSPDGGASLIFNFDIGNVDGDAPATYDSAALANLFYWNNVTHDVWYEYGFDEASRNFQENNYGNGGTGSDSVNAEAQDGGGTCNANFGTPGDGSNPTMQMYICGNRDGDMDNGVIVHEYTHGISNRLTGGASVSCLSRFTAPEQMGEGWSDWYALMMTIEAGDLGTDTRGMGTWLIGEGPTGAGIRTKPYNTDMAVNNHTYGNLSTMVIPHGVGEVWATMLWDMTWALVADGSQSGLDLDIYNGSGGNNLAMQLVTDGMKLQPCYPGFVDGRDAILTADQNLTGGANQCVIWESFARRGLGFSASQGSSSSISDGTEAFDMPTACLQTLKLDKTAFPNLAPTGGVLTYTLAASNDTLGTLTAVVISDTIQASQTYIPASATCGGTESGGIVTFPLGTLTSGQAMTCTFQVRVDSGLGSIEYFFDDMESGDGEWVTSSMTDTTTTWSLVGTNPHSGSNSWFAPDVAAITDQYLDTVTPILLTGTPVLRVWHNYDTEANFDGGVIEISTDNGLKWNDLGANATQNGYNSTISSSYSSPLSGRDAFSGNSGGYIETLIDLSSYAGETVLFRFRMATDTSVSKIGWFVDDVQIIEETAVFNTACIAAAEGDNDCDNITIAVDSTPPTDPQITIIPDSVNDTSQQIELGGTTPLSVTVRNNGNADLIWTVTEDSSGDCDTPTDISWVTGLTPTGGTTISHTNVIVDFTYDATGLAPAVYTGTLCFDSNDANTPRVTMALELTVQKAVAACSAPVDIPWIVGLLPSGGSIAAGASASVDVLFDSTGLALGTYQANICIDSNDPATPQVVVPVTMLVANVRYTYLPMIQKP